MRRLLVQQNQVSYAASFARPAFALWGHGGEILDGLYSKFSKWGADLSNFRFEQSSQEPAAQSLTVTLGSSCYYRLRLDRVESGLENFRREDLELFPGILQDGAVWLRTALPEFSFQSHLFTYFGHSKLSGGTSEEFLKSLRTFDLSEIGTSEGNGIIFHWTLPDRNWRIQLMVDHSLTVQSGLFLQFLLFITGDAINYHETAVAGRGILDKALKKIGLEIDDADAN